MNRKEVLKKLWECRDTSYKEFNDRIANCPTVPTLGVRVPELRRIAKEAAKEDWREYLDEMERDWRGGQETGEFHEEHTVWGILIGLARMDREERTRRLDRWVPGCLSWADCDICAATLKFMKKDREYWYDYAVRWLSAPQPFAARFAIVSLMDHFVEEEYIDRLLPIFSGSYGQEEYYIRMAQAWALSVCFVKFREKTLEILQNSPMDDWIRNKAIQKCRESYRVSPEDKELLKALKR